MTKKKKHNKKRNTAFLYEVLVREITKSIIAKDLQKKNIIISIVKEHFITNTELGKELQLYRTLASPQNVNDTVAEKLIQEVKKEHKKINKKKLFIEQSRIISKINKSLSKDVFSNFVPNYKNLATISQIFNDDVSVKNRVLLEAELLTLISEKEGISSNKVPISNLVYRTFLKKFNKTYGEALLQEQKAILQSYVLSFDDNGLQLKVFLNEELGRLKGVINKALISQDINSDESMCERTKKVLGLIESFKDKPFDKNMLTHILKIQSLAQEINK